MIPILFELGPLKVYSYGLMLGIAFLLGSYVLSLELKRKRMDPSLASAITIMAVVFGISGAKILHLLENWDTFVRDPIGEAFTPGGLTWYGGFVLAMSVLHVYLYRRRIPFLKVWDCLAVGLVIAYGVGRLGCHLSGDGDYGYPTQLPWGTIYAQGTAKPSLALEEYFTRHPEERAFWKYDSLRVLPGGVDRRGFRYTRFDEVTPLHPAPVYEFFLGLFGFFIIWQLRTRVRPDGLLFMIYIVITSIFRFGVEFIRVNPRLAAGLTEAQCISILMFLAGIIGALILSRRRTAQVRQE